MASHQRDQAKDEDNKCIIRLIDLLTKPPDPPSRLKVTQFLPCLEEKYFSSYSINPKPANVVEMGCLIQRCNRGIKIWCGGTGGYCRD